MLKQIFLEVLNMSWDASIVVAIVVAVRALLKRFPKFISYMLWTVVFFRFLCPVTLEMPYSPVLNLGLVFDEYIEGEDSLLSEGFGGNISEELDTLYIDEEMKNETQATRLDGITTKVDIDNRGISRQESLIFCGKYIWILGLGVMFLYCVISNMKMYDRVKASIPIGQNVYLLGEEISPFVMGIFKPKIYLPESLSKTEQKYIILHEKYHIRRLDHIIKPFAFGAVCIHWFNPLAWLAFILFCKDMEMSCDEAVIKMLGEDIRVDYSASLLALSTKNHVVRSLSVDFGEGDTKERVRNLASYRKTKKWILVIIIMMVIAIIICLAFNYKYSNSGINSSELEIGNAKEEIVLGAIKEEIKTDITINISDHYITSTGDPSNLYYIDENNVLWGSGRNEYGQLGQGTQDYEFHSENLQIAENVVHVDYSQKGFAIYITNDYKLYGMGNAGSGALQQYETFDWTRYTQGEHYTVTSPILLMEDVVYACCGRDDIVCIKKDGTVWTWGTICVEGTILSSNAFFLESPQKILENAVLITGGWFNHSALLQDGTVWTWGYNTSGNCGVADSTMISEPTMVAENVIMVWTGVTINSHSELRAEETVSAWFEELKYNAKQDNITEFGDEYPRVMNNTIIQKVDGSYWVCGENVGETERIVHGAEGDYSIICTHVFYLCQ